MRKCYKFGRTLKIEERRKYNVPVVGDLVGCISELLGRFFDRHRPVVEFQVWKTIKLGTGLKTADDVRNALAQGGCGFGEWASRMLEQDTFTVADEETEVDLVKVTLAELGFKRRTTLLRIFARAAEFGLERCFAEVGPQLRLQYPDQPLEEWIYIAMDPIVYGKGRLDSAIFEVGHPLPGLWLHGSLPYFDIIEPYSTWVFCRPRR